jgi:hypothetical protein
MEPFTWDHGALFHKQPYPGCLSKIRKGVVMSGWRPFGNVIVDDVLA